jgi:hypothetical protein
MQGHKHRKPNVTAKNNELMGAMMKRSCRFEAQMADAKYSGVYIMCALGSADTVYRVSHKVSSLGSLNSLRPRKIALCGAISGLLISVV